METVKPGGRSEALAGAAVGDSSAGVVFIVSFLAIFFVFTGEIFLVCCVYPNVVICESGTMVEVVAAPAVGEGGYP